MENYQMQGADKNQEEDELRGSEKRFRNLYENVAIGIAEVNINRSINNCNPAFCKMLGYSEEHIKKMQFKEFTHPLDVDKDMQFFNGLKERKYDNYTMEKRYIHKNGNVIWGNLTFSVSKDEDGNIESIIGTILDITEKKQSEEKINALNNELEQRVLERTLTLEKEIRSHKETLKILSDELAERKRSEKELRKLTCAVEQSPVSVVITDLEGTITYVNPKFTEVTGYTIDEAMGKNPNILKSGELDPNIYTDLWKTIKAGAIWHGEFHNKKKNGQLYFEAASVAPVMDENGIITNYVAVKEDISGIKVFAQELKMAKEEAEKANLAKSIFLASMSHEIRTPMNAILGFTQLLIKGHDLSNKQREYLESISKSGEHLLVIINDILEMSKIDAGRITIMPSAFDLFVFVQDIKKMLNTRAVNKGLKFISEIDDRLQRYILADENKLRQIFINLLDNAIKFVDKGSIIWRLRTEENTNGELMLISEIEDTGPGIADGDISRLFKPFEQTEVGMKAGGTGLGLAISKKFLKMMDGNIKLTSEVGKGSIFHVELKIMEHHGDKELKAIKYPEVIGIHSESKVNKVLIVDDVLENRYWLSELLKGIGFEIREASNGLEAVEVFEEWSPNIILMDIRMPVMDGYEAAKIIKSTQKGSTTPIIGITASVFEDDRDRIFISGMSSYLLKPFKDKALYKAIEELIDVKYIYENISIVEDMDEDKSDNERIALLPNTLFVKMHEATINGDLDCLLELIVEVTKITPKFGNQLRKLAINYQFEALLGIYSKVEEGI